MPFVDWNGNGRIDPQDIAQGLAIAEEEEKDEENGNGSIETRQMPW